MKQANNNEMDLMLRSLARRADEPHSTAGSNGDAAVSDHLDADELNSYAEGMVPDAARARYSGHLADCDSCRRIVVSLSQSAGVARDVTAADPRVGSNFWQKLAAFFSPAVLRYAIPALVLTVVIGAGLLALRQKTQDEFVAQNRAVDAPPAGNVAVGEAARPASSASPSSLSSATELQRSPEPRQEKSDLADQKAPVTSVTTGPDLAAAKAPADKDFAEAGKGADVAAGTYAMEPKAAPPPAPLSKAGESDSSRELAKEAPAKREDQQRSRDAFKTNEEEHGPSRSRSNTAQSAGGRAGGLMSNRGPSAQVQNQRPYGNVETRSVAGRYFTREGNTWVDTEYDSSRATVRVTRGSEQFRALIADEPAIRTISEQLGGVVIVIWKNRAYRIQ